MAKCSFQKRKELLFGNIKDMSGSFLDKLRCIMQWTFLAAGIIVPIYTDIFVGVNRYLILFIWLVLVANFFFGKLFCSHLCPGGLLSEKVMGIRKKFFASRKGIKKWSLPDKLLRSLKYIAIVVVVHYPLESDMEVGVLIAGVFVSIIILGLLVEDMFFCKYLCFINASSNVVRFSVFLVAAIAVNTILVNAGVKFPFDIIVPLGGYLLEIYFKKTEYNLSLLHVHRDISKCSECGDCTKVCPFAVEITSVKRVVDIDCNLCGECVRGCSRDAIKMGICNTRPQQNSVRGLWFAPLAVVILLIIVLVHFLKF